MSSFNEVEVLLSNREYPAIEMKPEHKLEAKTILLNYGVKEDSGFFKIYTKYLLGSTSYRSGVDEIVDPLPTRSFIPRVKFAHEVWGVPKNYILFSTGEGEGGYFYNTEDDSVWNFQMGQIQQLADGTLPHWDSFYEFMEWYLTDENDA
ncbi:hypothetical protein [Psychrobacter piscatorii]|uniref:hypothetical protein n=1 Tax=Psychrobacter piscatorii TaxID=554343 RepID=UPI0019189F1A|nr:hypothetical protein [Psychrobacter piscatorii]